MKWTKELQWKFHWQLRALMILVDLQEIVGEEITGLEDIEGETDPTRKKDSEDELVIGKGRQTA